MKNSFKLIGLDCANCAAELERELSKVTGIKSVNINFLLEKIDITYEDDANSQEVLRTIKKVIKREEPDASLIER